MNLIEAIDILDKLVPTPSKGLPDEVFYYISRTTPLVNVDLLVKDEIGRTLLAWRDDQYAGKGWHVPGGIVRFKETLEERVRQVAITELGVKDIHFDQIPIALNQIINSDHNIRGHFISILYKCFLSNKSVLNNKKMSLEESGYLVWHDFCPNNMIKVHTIYKEFI